MPTSAQIAEKAVKTRHNCLTYNGLASKKGIQEGV